MNIKNMKKKQLVIALIVFVVLTVVISKEYIDYQEQLNKIISEKNLKQSELADAKKKYQESLDKMNDANNTKAKETKVREKLNMIKKDEIQFSFTE